jgi:YjbE family integral membrane protein
VKVNRPAIELCYAADHVSLSITNRDAHHGQSSFHAAGASSDNPVVAYIDIAGSDMELLSTEFLSALAAIVVIDLVLAGDNAIVIALAARGLPAHLRKPAIVWGTVGAIVVRTAMTLVVVWLLRIPGLLAAGGALLVWIAYKLVIDNDSEGEDHLGGLTTFWGAMKTIVVADALMGLDNVLAVAGAAQGSFVLVVAGLLISIPIVIWGSQLILKYVERFPAIVYIGAGVLAWTAVKMVTSEPLLEDFLAQYRFAAWIAYALVIGGVVGGGFLVNHAQVRRRIAALVERDASAPAGIPPERSTRAATRVAPGFATHKEVP